MSITDLANTFGVSEMSIRRDAAVLEDLQLIRRVRGGVLSLDLNTREDGNFPQRDLKNTAIKKRIARHAVELANPGDVLAIDAGTTAYQVAKSLDTAFRGTIITHSLPVLNHLVQFKQANTISLGGELYSRSQAFVGSIAVNACSGLRATTFFMGAAAISTDGIYAAWDAEKDIKRALAGISQKIVLVVDHTKFQASAPVFLMGWSNKITVITDSIPSAARQALGNSGVHIDIA